MPNPTRLTRDQVRAVDRIAIEKYHVPGIVLMENAARGVVDVAMPLLDDKPSPRALVLCGGGNNGGDGLAVARHLHNRGVTVHLFLMVTPDKYRGDALINWQIVDAMKLTCLEGFDSVMRREYDLIIDAIFGTGLSTPPKSPPPRIFDWINGHHSGEPIIAVDLPSGLDCDTGLPLGPACIRATRTVTFVAEKAGFANPASRQYTGDITVADIGCPREVIDEVLQMK